MTKPWISDAVSRRSKNALKVLRSLQDYKVQKDLAKLVPKTQRHRQASEQFRQTGGDS